MSIGRDDRYVADAQGRALAGALVYYCTQPASTSALPPSPLATVYSDITGDAGVNPVTTDGFGHSVAYLSNSQLYTVVISHPLFGANPIVLTDQAIPATGSSSNVTPVQASTTADTITGAINGSNRVFTLPSTPLANSLVLQYNGQVLTPNLGYTISGSTITLAIAPVAGPPPDNLNANYFI